ncbi:divergent PAP2 family protein [Paenibacillus sp. TAB 01]|uniref:divergent PAP2 family protein n=1 Tax=Paenibacillus sp. TAB 01 TaxID=3368988 RepID=UPI0037508429
MNRGFITALTTIGLAQALKVPVHYSQTGKWDWCEMIKAGGMPSSHSAGVTALATYVGFKKGVSSIHFAIASILSVIVMYDAMGIRRQAGIIATEVNELEEAVGFLAEQHPELVHEKRGKQLEEKLGHLPEEVLAGAMLGICTGALSYAMEVKA